MGKQLILSVSIVLFNENLTELTKTIDCFLELPIQKKLFLIDNTPKNIFKNKFYNEQIEYISSDDNIGFGAGHNKIIHKIKGLSKFHLILNPTTCLLRPHSALRLLIIFCAAHFLERPLA